MAQLVRSGLAQPGQTSWALLNSISLDMLLDLAYAMLVEGLEPDDRRKIDAELRSLDEDTRVVEKVASNGRVVEISEARLERMRRNLGGMQRIMSKRK